MPRRILLQVRQPADGVAGRNTGPLRSGHHETGTQRDRDQYDGELIGGWALVGDDIWMTGERAIAIYRASLTTLKVTLVVPVPALALENINGRLLTLDATGKLLQIDPARGSVMASWKLPTPDKQNGSSQLDIFEDGTGNGIWVNQLSTQMTHIDLTTGQIRTITGLPDQPEVNPAVVTADGVAWVTDWKDSLVLRMKP